MIILQTNVRIEVVKLNEVLIVIPLLTACKLQVNIFAIPA